MKILNPNITNSLRFRILFPVMIITLLVTMLEIYYLRHYAFNALEKMALDTEYKNALQVKNSIDRYFESIDSIAQKPLNTVEITSLLRKNYTNISTSEKSKDQYSIQMFLFREIMLQNPDIESSLIYDASEESYCGISDTYTLYKDSYYNFSKHDRDFKTLESSQSDHFISGIHKNYMLIEPHESYVVTYGTGFSNHFTKENPLYGAFYMNITVSAFSKLCRQNYTETAGSCYLIDQNNKIVYCEDSSMTGHNISNYFPIESHLKSSKKATMISQKNVYTITNTSHITNWRIVTVSDSDKLFGNKETIFHTVFTSMLILILIISCTLWIIISSFTKSISVMKQQLQKVSEGNLQVSFEKSKGEIGEVNEMIQQMLDNINQLICRIYKEENDKRELQLHSLQNQITPHFIYNTLSRLKWMASMQQADTLSEAIGSFSDILAYCMRSTNYFIRIDKEIEFLQNYVQIMNLRMMNEVHVSFHIPEDVHALKILRFLLQPIVENVFQHAFPCVNRKCLLFISACVSNNTVIFSIKDNGVGMSQEKIERIFMPESGSQKVSHASIALQNIQQRIIYHYGLPYGMSITSSMGEGTTIILTIPYQPDD